MDSLVITIWGEEKTGKSTLALTFPTPIYHFDLDVGGFARAAWRFKNKDIRSKPYVAHDELEKLLKGDITVKAGRRVLGMKELWQEIIVDYAKVLQDTAIATVVMDSGTQLWSICHSAFLQEKQEAQGKVADGDLRERLQPMEYGAPNARMRSIIYAARSYKKNLVITHYPRDIYITQVNSDGKVVDVKSGKIEPDGFKENRRLTDLEISTFIDKSGAPRSIITRSGISMEALNIELEPTYDAIIPAIQMMRGE